MSRSTAQFLRQNKATYENLWTFCYGKHGLTREEAKAACELFAIEREITLTELFACYREALLDGAYELSLTGYADL